MKRATSSVRRKILCVFPRYSPSFGTFENAYPIVGVKAFMPPQGILVIASYLPENWEVRFRDENLQPANAADFTWADAVFASGMHIQRGQIDDINRRAHAHGTVTVLGGPSVSGCPEYYPDYDYLHVGELGDATDDLIRRLEASTQRPPSQVRLEAVERLPLADFPVPAYHMTDLSQYFLGSVQFSSGCPYRCEFCDIPELYGRNPRLKTPEQIVGELDAILAAGGERAIYFVDDNFVGNRKAAKELLPHLIAWQKKNGFAVQLACEATLNIAKSPDLLEMMREAYFCTIFCGIETPDPKALHEMAKDQNNAMPVMDAINIIHAHGMEVVSGIIMGLDSDTAQTPDMILEFIEASKIPLLTINLLQALPRTPLYRRLQAEGRLVDEPGRESNVEFKLPYDQMIAMWRRVFTTAYQPEAIYRRFAYHVDHVFPNRIKPPNSPQRVNARNIRKALSILGNLLVRVGIFSHYRHVFWKMARAALKRGDIEAMFHIGLVSHHLITFARQASEGKRNASFYSENLDALKAS
ncbi:MAG: B12-binding domain-containing radical SAM protein [Candidatus Eremiobacteraeota bacterium]|nr:B12-binding domain-containing radical SAM protein [Candidatus Eremiobacteraeota bacterium]